MTEYHVNVLVKGTCHGYFYTEVEAESEDEAYAKAVEDGLALYMVEDLQLDNIASFERESVDAAT